MSSHKQVKIVGIGFNKTSTSSLGKVLLDMGYGPVCGPEETREFFHYKHKYLAFKDRKKLGIYRSNSYDYPHRNLLSRLNSSIDAIYALSKYFRSFQDRPWNTKPVYSMLFSKYPRAKFILTRRGKEAWWESVSTWLENKSRHDDEIVSQYLIHLGASGFTRQEFIERYDSYNNEAIAFFDKAPSRLLVLDLEDDKKLAKLNSFIRPKKPAIIYPCINKYVNQTKAT